MWIQKKGEKKGLERESQKEKKKLHVPPTASRRECVSEMAKTSILKMSHELMCVVIWLMKHYSQNISQKQQWNNRGYPRLRVRSSSFSAAQSCS